MDVAVVKVRNTSDGIIITVPNIKYLNPGFFSHLFTILSHFTIHLNATLLKNNKPTTKKRFRKEYSPSHVHREELKLCLVCTTGQNKHIKCKIMRKIKSSSSSSP